MSLRLKVSIKMPKERLFDTARALRAVENQLDMTAAAAQIDFQVTTTTWNHKVVFEIMKKQGLRFVHTNDKIYFFLNNGTSVRYATMSPDFRPKSRPGAIRANKGRGKMLFVDKSRPKPGIQARKWDEAIQQKWDKEFAVQMQRAIDSAVQMI